MPFVPGGIVHFPKDTCAQCPLKAQCTTSAKGRSVSIHPDEALLIELRQRQQTPQGRAQPVTFKELSAEAVWESWELEIPSVNAENRGRV
jgi:uncharacterized protein (UPF0179 family)